jgi:hypothetical protein
MPFGSFQVLDEIGASLGFGSNSIVIPVESTTGKRGRILFLENLLHH